MPGLPRRAALLAACLAAAGPSVGARPASGFHAVFQIGGPAIEQRPSFAEWLEGVRAEALSRGIRTDVIERALSGIEPLDIVVERDRNQAEFSLSLDAYLKRRLTPALVRTARAMASRHRALAGRVAAVYGVPPEVLIAAWGLESNFGRFSGLRPTISTLATLAYDARRSEFFRSELMAALQILDNGDVETSDLKGSWAGAIGQPQFMPSSYLTYAVDFDDDGRRDIWRSLPDVLASIANYLKAHGWSEGQRWGREVRVPDALEAIATAAPPREAGCVAVRNMSQPLPLVRWRQLGVRLVDRRALPAAPLPASLVHAERRSFLVYENYEALLAYNCAHAYALSVGLLADRIAGQRRDPR